jgi:hypothetical protein
MGLGGGEEVLALLPMIAAPGPEGNEGEANDEEDSGDREVAVAGR